MCIFAYGQTGSGKTYTMAGVEGDAELEGIIPRVSRDLFARAAAKSGGDLGTQRASLSSIGCPVGASITVSFVEIYCERVKDLLRGAGASSVSSGPDSPAPKTPGARSSGGAGRYSPATPTAETPLKVREHPKQGPFVEGATIRSVSTCEEMLSLVAAGQSERTTASTAMNSESSRSHSIFTIVLTQQSATTVAGDNEEAAVVADTVSKCNLIDLAGSESSKHAQTSGASLKEGASINNSLLVLGRVIKTLAESGGRGQVRVPYRDSVLTYLLKDSLGGNSRSTMM